MGAVARGWAEQELAALDAGGLRRALETVRSPQGATVQVGDQTLLNFSSNDYLGLANHPALRAAAQRALGEHGAGSGASRLIVGDLAPHRTLEAAVRAFERTESALLFGSGYAANVGIISALVGKGDAVFSDALNHASLIDGCRLSRAETIVYPHADLDALEQGLRTISARRKLIVTDAVFSMDGDLAPLEGIVSLAERHGAAVLVDEAHATGVLGERGAGGCEAAGVEARVDVRMGTLGKALGSYGAYAACAQPVADLLVNRARSLVFSTSLPPSACAAAEAAIALVQSDPSLRERLWANVRRFAAGLCLLGVEASPRSPIFPVLLGEPERAMGASRALRERGLLVKGIRPPTVPRGTSRLRFAISAAHTAPQIDHALEALGEVLGR